MKIKEKIEAIEKDVEHFKTEIDDKIKGMKEKESLVEKKNQKK